MKVQLYLLVTILFLVQLISCLGCEKEPENGSFLDKEYPFIVGLITPDTLRNYRHEVFVGRIKPIAEDGHIDSSEDPWNYLATRTMHSYYRAKVVGTSGAVVSIHDEKGDSVVFAEVKEGIYQDVGNLLNVEPQKTYRLHVYVGNKHYTGITTTPGNFKHFGPADGDTIDFPVQWDYGIYKGIQYLSMTPSAGAYFYRNYVVDKVPTESGDRIQHFFRENEAKLFHVFDTSSTAPRSIKNLSEVTMEITAIDPKYALMYRAGGGYTGTDDWFKWFEQQNPFPVNSILEHSTITGDGEVAGTFGSYNRITLHYWARGIVTSLKSETNKRR